MTISRAEETYIISDTYQECQVSGTIIIHENGTKTYNFTMSKDDKMVQANVGNTRDGIFIQFGGLDYKIMLDYLKLNLDELFNFNPNDAQ